MPAGVTANEKNMSNGFAHKIADPSSLNVVSGCSSLQNIAVNYMYRDASNYKRCEEVVLSNPRRVSASELWLDIQGVLKEMILFYGEPMFHPEWVGLPTVFIYSLSEYSINEDDHDLHELCSVKETDDPVSRGVEISVDEFVGALLKTHSRII